MELPDDADKIPLVFLARFTIYEDALSGSVKLVITRTAGAADSNSPHVLVLSSAHEIQAQHSISLPLLSTAATSPASAGAVTSVTAGDLVDGATYSVTVKYQDRAGNPENTDFVSFVVFDTTKPTVTGVTLALGDGTLTIDLSESINIDGLLRDTFFNQDAAQPWTEQTSQAMNVNNLFVTNIALQGTIGLGSSTLVSTTDSAQLVFKLTENQRITAIENSGTPGGDGIALVFDAITRAFFDQATNGNALQFDIPITEQADTIKLTLDTAVIDYSTGILQITASERINLDTPASMVFLNRLFISDIAGDQRISMFGATVTAADSPTVTLQLTETQRVQAIALSATPGGDGTSIVIDSEDGAFQDIGLVASQATDGFVTWTITTNSITPTAAETVSTAVTQAATSTTGKLSVALDGTAVTQIVVFTSIGQTIATDQNLVVGATTIAHADLLSIASSVTTVPSHPAKWVATIGAADITKNAAVTVSQPSVAWTLLITPSGITETAGANVGQNGNAGKLKFATSNVWTITMDSTAVTKTLGTTVTQGSSTGTLAVALTGAGQIKVVINCASSVSFDTSVDLDVGGVVVSASALNAAINTGATKSIVIVAAVGQTFGTEHPLTIGGYTVLASDLLSLKSYAATTGTLKVPLTGAFTASVQIEASAGVHFSTLYNLIIDGKSCTPASTNAVCSSISLPANQLACDLQSVGTCAGGGGTQCTNVANGREALCTGTNDDASQACVWTSTNLCTYSASTTIVASSISALDRVLLPGLSVTETADTTAPVIQSAAIQFGPGTMQLTVSETVDVSPITHVDLTKLFINPTSTNEWTMGITTQTIRELADVVVSQVDGNGDTITGTLTTALDGAVTSVVIGTTYGKIFASGIELLIGSTPVIAGRVLSATKTTDTRISVLGLDYEQADTAVISSVDGNTVFFQLPEKIRVAAIVFSAVQGGDLTATLMDALADVLFDIGLNGNVQTLQIAVTESPDLIVPTMTKAKLFYDQPAVLQLDFSETIDVDPTLLIDKTKIKIVDYQGQTTGAVTLVSCHVTVGGTNNNCVGANADTATCTAANIANTCTVTGGGANVACGAANADLATCSAANDGNPANNCLFVDNSIHNCIFVEATQSTVQGLIVNFTLTEAQRVSALLFSGTPGGDGYRIWAMTINSQDIGTQNTGVAVTQANGYITWEFHITSTIITKAQDAAVTQTSQSGVGTLTYGLSGAQTIVYVTSAVGQVFDKTADLIVGGTTVALAKLLDLEHITIPNAVGTLTTGVSAGAITTVSITTLSSSVTFDKVTDLVVGSATINKATITAAAGAVYGGALLDVTAGAFRDMGENLIVNHLGFVIDEQPDITRPIFNSAELDLNDGVLRLGASETLDVSLAGELDLSRLHIVDATGNTDTIRNDVFYHTKTHNAVNLAGAAPATVSPAQATVITITLTEDQRNLALVLSNTAGGDSSQLRIDFDARVVHDIAQLDNVQDNNFLLTEIADTTKPSIESVTLDYATGILIMTASEVLDVSPDSNMIMTMLWLENSTDASNSGADGCRPYQGDCDQDVVSLNGAQVNLQESQSITIFLTEEMRVRALALSGVPGGDLVGLQLRVERTVATQAIRDLAGNGNAATHSVTIVESPDNVAPFVHTAHLNYTNGQLTIRASETLDTTPISKVDTSLLRLVNSISTWTLTVDSQPLTASVGDVVTQGGYAIGILKTELTGAGMTEIVISAQERTEWTITTSSVTVNEQYYVPVSQNSVVVGYLKTALSGAITELRVYSTWYETGPTITTTDNLVVGTTTINAADISTATNTAFDTASALDIGGVPVAQTTITAVAQSPHLETGSTTVSLSGCTVIAADGTDITLVLTEAQRAAAIAISGIHGGDGGSVFFDVLNGGLRDIAQNTMLNDFMSSVNETRDTKRPIVQSAAIDYSTGVLEITVDETIDCTPNTNVDPSKIQISESASAAEGLGTGVKLTGATVTQTDGTTFTVTLTELQRSLVIAMSGTPGGDNTAVVLDFEFGAILDVGVNHNRGAPSNQGITVTETADTIKPSVTQARLNYGTGVMEIDTDEIIDVTPGSLVLLPNLFLADSSGDDYLVLDGATVSGADGQTFTVTLNEAQRAQAVVESGVLGGDSTALVLDAKINSIQDIGQNKNAGELSLTVTETSDVIRPFIIKGAFLSLGDGVLSITASESVLHRTVDVDGINIINTRSRYVVTLSAAQTIAEDFGVVVTQTSASTTWRLTLTPATVVLENKDVAVSQNGQTGVLQNHLGTLWTMAFTTGQTIAENKGVAVYQSNGYMTWTLTTNSITVTESQGVTVKQTRLTYPNHKISTGTLHTELTGAGTTTVVITTLEGVTLDAGTDVLVGSTTIDASDILSASFVTQGGATGLTTLSLSGTTTTFNIVSAPGVTFDTTTDLIIGGTTIAHALLNTATLGGTTTYVEITAASGQTFDLLDDLLVGSTLIAASKLESVTSYVQSISGVLAETLAGSSSSVVIDVTSGVFHTDTDLVIGGTTIGHAVLGSVAYTPYVTENPLTGASLILPSYRTPVFNITMTEAQRVRAIELSGTQGGDTKEAALLIFPYRFSDLSHNYNEQEITLQMFELPDEILPTVLSASLNLENGVLTLTTSETIDVTPGNLVDVTKFELHQSSNVDEWTVKFAGQGIAESQGATVTQGSATGTLTHALYNTWTLAINSQSLDYDPGDTVTQGSVSGVLHTELTGAGMTAVLVNIPSGAVLDTTTSVVVTNGGITSTINPDNINTATSSLTTSCVISAVAGTVFDTSANLVIGGTTVLLANLISSQTSTLVFSRTMESWTSNNQPDGTTFQIVLTEQQRAIAIAISSVRGGDGSPIVMDIELDGYQDIATNKNVQQHNIVLSETEDDSEPSVVSATIFLDDSDPRLELTGDETLDMTPATQVSLSSLILKNDTSHQPFNDFFPNELYLPLTAATVVTTDGVTVTIQLTESQRVEALYHGATPGGDATPILFQSLKNAFKDIGQNLALKSQNLTVTEVPDTNPPTITAVAIDLGSGVITFDASETLDFTPQLNQNGEDQNNLIGNGTDVNKIFISDHSGLSSGSFNISLKTAFITTYTDVLQFFVVLPEESRAQAIRISGQPGGDGVAAFVDILTNTIMDIGQNPNVVNQSLQLTESPDEIKPIGLNALLNYGTGILKIRFSETIKAVDLTKIRVVNQANDVLYPMTAGEVQSVDSTYPVLKLSETDRLATLAISATPGGDGFMDWTIECDSSGINKVAGTGVTVSQANGYETWTISLGSSVTAVESIGATVTQTSQSGTGTLIEALDGTGATRIVVQAALGQIFDSTADLIINSGSTTISAATNTYAQRATTANAAGTLYVMMVGASSQIVIRTATVGITFDTVTDININGEVFSHTHLNSAASVTYGNVLIDLDAGAVLDVAGNANLAQVGILVTELPDDIPPTVLSSTLDYSTGILTFTCTETIDVTPASMVDLGVMFISDLSKDHAVSLAGATILSTVDNPTITIELTEVQRAAAIAISGVPGGDTDAVVLDAEPGSLTDITGMFFFLFIGFLKL